MGRPPVYVTVLRCRPRQNHSHAGQSSLFRACEGPNISGRNLSLGRPPTAQTGEWRALGGLRRATECGQATSYGHGGDFSRELINRANISDLQHFLPRGRQNLHVTACGAWSLNLGVGTHSVLAPNLQCIAWRTRWKVTTLLVVPPVVLLLGGGEGDILVGVGSTRWHCDLVLDPLHGGCSHQKGSLDHERRVATLRVVIEHDDTFERLGSGRRAEARPY